MLLRTLTAIPLTTVTPALLLLAVGLADAESFNALVLRAGAQAAGFPTAVVSALHSLTDWLADAVAGDTLILDSDALAALSAATVKPAILACAGRHLHSPSRHSSWSPAHPPHDPRQPSTPHSLPAQAGKHTHSPFWHSS